MVSLLGYNASIFVISTPFTQRPPGTHPYLNKVRFTDSLQQWEIHTMRNWEHLVRWCWKGLIVGFGLVLGDSGEAPRKRSFVARMLSESGVILWLNISIITFFYFIHNFNLTIHSIIIYFYCWTLLQISPISPASLPTSSQPQPLSSPQYCLWPWPMHICFNNS